MEWGIKLKNNREDLFKKRFWRLIGKMIISFTIIVIFFMVLKRIIELSDFQWLYNKNNVTYYRAIYTFDLLYYNGYVYVALAVIAIIIFLILLYKEIKSMTSYINVISDSSERLFDGSEEYISLPPEMKELEIKLNHFRSESIKNKKLAEENEKKKDELIVYLAHDIKTPLTVVIGYLSLLDEIEDMPLKQRKKYIELALNKSYRLEELINELFDIARFNSEKIILEKEELNLNIMLEQVIEDFYPILKEINKNINLNTGDNINIYADSDKLSRVFNNLIKNAINYSKENTDIDINVKKRNKEIEVKIINQGKMIPKDKLDKIFENFYRLDTSRTSKTGGSGLGLAISKQIVELHGGNIKVNSDKNKTIFTIILPIEEELYSGFNINLKAEFDGLRTNLMIDITTGDVITYKEVQFEYKTLFDNEIVNIMTYNYEAIIGRNIDNTRMKDYYDLYMFVNLKWNDIDKTILRKAIFNTSEKRETLNYIENADKYIELINEDSKLKSLWKNYQNTYAYAKDISFENTIAAIKVINGVIVPAKV